MNVLLLEDERAQADCLALMLREEGYATDVAYGASQALAAARVHRPDVVLADLRMRGASALSCLETISSELGAMPMMVITGLPREHPDVETAVKQLHCSFMQKPIEVDQLFRFLKSSLHEVHS